MPRLQLLRLASQALPTGAFAYSTGLESLCELGYLQNESACVEYLTSLLRSAFVHLELPLFSRMRAAFLRGDLAEARSLSAYLLAARESRELQDQERQMGRALGRVLSDLHAGTCADWQPGTFVEALARASVLHGIDEQDAATLLVYTWLEQQVSAMTRLLPLGPIAGQRVMDGVLRAAPEAIEAGLAVPDDEIGASSPMLSIASALHETQYTRIFRS